MEAYLGGIANFEETGASIEDCENCQCMPSQVCLDFVPMGGSPIFATSHRVCSDVVTSCYEDWMEILQ